MMPSALAWVITVVLALIDLALVALIVYLVIRLIDKKMFDRYDGYDDYLEPEEEQYEYGEDGATEAFDEGSDNEKCVEKESPDEISDEASDEVEGFCEDVTEETVAFGENRVGGAVAVLAERKKAPALAERKKAPTLKAAPAFARLFAPAAKLRIAPGPQLIYLMPPAPPEMLESVTVEEADRMMTDEEAFSYEKTDIISTEVYSGNKKAIVNVDAIGRVFEAGDVVSINTLKEKKLISQKVGWIKVLGKGVLDKPLTVIAQNYSASAVKMIVLTGGTAILAEGSPERRK